MAQQNNLVVEIVVFKIKQENVEEYLSKLEQLHAILKQFQGFRSLTTYRSAEHPNQFTDCCVWNSLEDAKRANERAMSMPELAPLFALGEGIVSFDHYSILRTTEV